MINPETAKAAASLLVDLTVGEMMHLDPIVIYSDESLSEALKCFTEKRIFYLPVVNRSRRLQGILTQKYLYKIRSPRRIIDETMEFNDKVIRDGDSFYEKETLDSYILSNIMFKTPFTMHPDDTAAEAILHMADKRLGCIPVVKDNAKICGVLTAEEVMLFLSKIIRDNGEFIGE